MLNFITEPSTITFSENPVVYRIQAAGLNGQPFRAKGARSIMETTALGFEIGGFLTLNIQEADGTPIVVKMTAKADPTGEFEFLYNDEFFNIAQQFANHRLIAPSVKVTFSESNGVKTFTAEAREIEPNWIVLWTVEGISTEITNFDFSVMNAPTGYRVGYEVFFEKEYLSAKWESVFEGFCHARDNGDDVYINISDVLSRECKASLRENPFSLYSRTQPVLADNLRRYYVRFKESAANIAPVWTLKPVQTVLIGGLPNHEWLTGGGLDSFNASRSILSYQPTRYIQRNGIEWLSWYNYTFQEKTVKLEIVTILNSGQTETFTKSQILVPVFRTATFAVTATALQLSEFVRAYNIRVIDATTESPLSAWKLYVCEDDFPQTTRLLGYLNAFGVPETAICAGDLTRKVAIVDRRAQGVRGSSSAGQITRTERNIIDYSIQYTYRSGYINTLQKEAYTELRLSSVLFDVTTPNYLALVLKAEQTSDTISDTGERIYSAEWFCDLRIAPQNFGLDSLLRAASTLTEPVFSIGNGTPVTNTGDVIGTDDPIDTPDYVVPTMDWEWLGAIQDTDLLLFAKVNATGDLVGFRRVESGEYMRHIRGIALDSPSHLDGLGMKTPNGAIWIESKDDNGMPSFDKQ